MARPLLPAEVRSRVCRDWRYRKHSDALVAYVHDEVGVGFYCVHQHCGVLVKEQRWADLTAAD